MKRLCVSLATVMVATSLLASACTQTAPPPAPTKAPAAPTKAAEPAKPVEPTKVPAAPTKAAAVQPTAVPVKKVDFPAKGKSITIIVPTAAGGSTDIGARVLAPMLEKELGVPFEIINRGGSGAQIGLTELSKAKPDGYTLGFTNMHTAIVSYLDPTRKAVYNRKSFRSVAMHVVDPGVVAVKADSPFKTFLDVIEAAKANPKKIRAGATGPLNVHHIATVHIEKLTGTQFAVVHFEGDAQVATALLGGHLDVHFGTHGVYIPHLRSGEVRFLGILDTEESRFAPGVKTLEAMGYKVYSDSSRLISAPGETPTEIVEILAQAMKKVMQSPEHLKKMEELGLNARYMTIAEADAYWDDYEARVRPVVEEFRMQK